VAGEVAAVQWSGIQQAWEAADIMADQYVLRDVMHAAELWLEADSQRLEAKDVRASANALILYREEVAKLIYTCRYNTWPIYELQIPESLLPRPTGTQLILFGKLASPNESVDHIANLGSVASTNRHVTVDFPGTPTALWVYIALPGDFGLGVNPSGFILADAEELTTIPMGSPGSAYPYGTQTLNGYHFVPMTIYGKPYRVFRTAIAYLADLAILIQ
jgi:hypothetical protein